MKLDTKSLVQEFYTTAGISHPKETHIALIREEVREVIEAAQNLAKELADLEYVLCGAELDGLGPQDLPEDLIEDFLRSGAVLDRLDEAHVHEEVFIRVHQSNMSKLTDGVLMRDPETGKVLKGPNYQPPSFDDLI